PKLKRITLGQIAIPLKGSHQGNPRPKVSTGADEDSETRTDRQTTRSALKSRNSWPPSFMIPAPPSDFQGRAELETALSKFEEKLPAFSILGGFELVLIGPKHAGKTTVARSLAHDLKDEGFFPDGGIECQMCDASGVPIRASQLLKEIIEHF